MRKKGHSVNPFSRSIVSGFLLVALGTEGMHEAEHSQPHTRREEEFKENHDELVDAMQSRNAWRHIGVGGGGDDPPLVSDANLPPNTVVLVAMDKKLYMPVMDDAKGRYTIRALNLGSTSLTGIKGPGGAKL